MTHFEVGKTHGRLEVAAGLKLSLACPLSLVRVSRCTLCLFGLRFLLSRLDTAGKPAVVFGLCLCFSPSLLLLRFSLSLPFSLLTPHCLLFFPRPESAASDLIRCVCVYLRSFSSSPLSAWAVFHLLSLSPSLSFSCLLLPHPPPPEPPPPLAHLVNLAVGAGAQIARNHPMRMGVLVLHIPQLARGAAHPRARRPRNSGRRKRRGREERGERETKKKRNKRGRSRRRFLIAGLALPPRSLALSLFLSARRSCRPQQTKTDRQTRVRERGRKRERERTPRGK